MADVSKLRLDNVTYDIKDDNARKYLVMVNEEPVSATKMVVETGGDAIELALQSDVDILRGANVVWIGDSYVQANSLGESDRQYRFSTRVSAMLGMTEFNYAIGGSGFLAPSGSTYKEQLDTAVAEMTGEEKSLTKYVFICGGRNDPYLVSSWTLSDLNTAVHDAIIAARDNYPNATIVCVPMTWAAEPLNTTYQRYLSEVIACCQNQNAPVMLIKQAWTWLIGQQAAILSDNIHPNIIGHQTIAYYLFSSLKGADSYKQPVRYTITSNGFTITIKLINNRVDVYISGTPTSQMGWASFIVQNYNLGQYGSIRTDEQFPVTLVGRDGTAGLVQIYLGQANGNCICSVQVICNSLTTQSYNGSVTFENGMKR